MFDELVRLDGLGIIWDKLAQYGLSTKLSRIEPGIISSTATKLSSDLPSFANKTYSRPIKRMERCFGYTMDGADVHQMLSTNPNIDKPTTSSQAASASMNKSCTCINLAPLCLIDRCSINGSSSGVNGRVTANTPYHLTQISPATRGRSATWYHRFYSHQSWVVLRLTLPCPILLHSVVIHPNRDRVVSQYPSYVSITAAVGQFSRPISELVPTAHLHTINISMEKPVLASSVSIRLYKPKESDHVVLSQIKLMGKTAAKGSEFDGNLFKNSDLLIELLRKTIRDRPDWRSEILASGCERERTCEALVNLYLCKTRYLEFFQASPSLYLDDSSSQIQDGAKESTEKEKDINQCQTDIEKQANKSNSTYISIDNKKIEICPSNCMMEEMLILSLCRERSDWLECFVVEVLGHPKTAQQSITQRTSCLKLLFTACVDNFDAANETNEAENVSINIKDKMTSDRSNFGDVSSSLFDYGLFPKENDGKRDQGEDAVVGITDTPTTDLSSPTSGTGNPAGIYVVLHWLESLLSGNDMSSSPDMLLTVASIIWHGKAFLATYERTAEILRLTMKAAQAEHDIDRKKALDYIICAFCHVCPHFVPQVLGLNLDMRQEIEHLSRSQLETLMTTCCSPDASEYLLNSNLLEILVQQTTSDCYQIFKFLNCSNNRSLPKSPHVLSEDLKSFCAKFDDAKLLNVGADELAWVTQRIDLLSSLCLEQRVQDWIVVSVMPLCQLLLAVISLFSSTWLVMDRVELVGATYRLLKNMIGEDRRNCKVIAGVLCEHLQTLPTIASNTGSKVHSLPASTQCLVSDLLLHDEVVFIDLRLERGSMGLPKTLQVVDFYNFNLSSSFLNHPSISMSLNQVRLCANYYMKIGDVIEKLLYGSKSETNKSGKKIEKTAPPLPTTSKKADRISPNSVAKEKQDKKWTLSMVVANIDDSSQENDPTQAAMSSDEVGKTPPLVKVDKNLSVGQVLKAQQQLMPGIKRPQLVLQILKCDPEVQPADQPSLSSKYDNVSSRNFLDAYYALTNSATVSTLKEFKNVEKFEPVEKYPNSTESFVCDNFESFDNNDSSKELLQEFSLQGGLSLLSQRMSILSKGEAKEESTPSHALGAFSLFLRLPMHGKMLAANPHYCRYMLRRILGVTDQLSSSPLSEGKPSMTNFSANDIYAFFMKSLLENGLDTKTGIALRCECLSEGVLHYLLAVFCGLLGYSDVASSLKHESLPIGHIVADVRRWCNIASKDDLSNSNNKPCSKGFSGESEVPTFGDRRNYWAKGTGFGTGSTNQTWNIEQSLKRQGTQEEHIIWLLNILYNFIKPIRQSVQASDSDITNKDIEPPKKFHAKPEHGTGGNSASDVEEVPEAYQDITDERLKNVFEQLHSLLADANIMKKICSYLSNDSVLDISRHVPLYDAIFSFVGGIATNNIFVPLVNHNHATPHSSTPLNLFQLLYKLSNTLQSYISKLDVKQWKKQNISSTRNNVGARIDDQLDDEGLSTLSQHLTRTIDVVRDTCLRLSSDSDNNSTEDSESPAILNNRQSLMEVYLEVMKPLQYDSYEMITEDIESGRVRFVVSHAFEKMINNTNSVGSRRIKRLAQEAVTLSSSLPLSYSSSVFLRTDTSRLDVMKVLISGPEDTPYANGLFEFDVFFPADYPNSPLLIKLETTGRGRVRFNPNLYANGKVCLSILNTWQGRPEEKWNARTSSLLQVLVSIQSLILVPEPYFNEPGLERTRGSNVGLLRSKEYDANIRTNCVQLAMIQQLKNPSPCFADVIKQHFKHKSHEITEQVEEWISDMRNTIEANARCAKTISPCIAKLTKLLAQLKEELAKLDIREEPDQVDCAFSETSTSSVERQKKNCDEPANKSKNSEHNVGFSEQIFDSPSVDPSSSPAGVDSTLQFADVDINNTGGQMSSEILNLFNNPLGSGIVDTALPLLDSIVAAVNSADEAVDKATSFLQTALNDQEGNQ